MLLNVPRHLSFAETSTPRCDYSQELALDWAVCFAGNAISELTPLCDGKGMAATTYYAIQVDFRTELHKPFFYDSDVPRRAATIFHEARHADGWCQHTDNCAAGANACDPNFDEGCVGLASSDKKGAYAWTVTCSATCRRTAADSGIRLTAIAVPRNPLGARSCHNHRSVPGLRR